MQYDAIIVGGGIAGLSTAAILSRKGHKILLLEKKSILGGRARCEDIKGFKVDYGIHFNRFGRHGRCANVMREIGMEPEFVTTGKPLIYHNGEFHPMPDGIKEFLKTGLLSRSSKRKLLKIALSLPFTNHKKYFHSPLIDWLLTKNPPDDLKKLIELLCAVGLICPYIDKVSAREARLFLQETARVYLRGGDNIGYIKGGWTSLLKRLEHEIQRNGEILTSTSVEGIAVDNGIVTEVVTDKERYWARCTICTVPFLYIDKILDVTILSSEVQEYIRNLEPVSGVGIDFGLFKPISDKNGFIITMDPWSMGCFTSNVEPSIAPPGKQLGAWFMQVPYEKIKNREYAKAQLKSLKAIINNMFPGIWEVCEWERPLILDLVDGAMPKVGQTRTERAPLSSNIPNLFFAGDSTAGLGLGGDIAFDSALKCARIVDEYLG